jgi:hypothetical protein
LLRQVVWPDKFKVGHIDKYDRSSNPEEFIQIYHTIIEAAGGDDREKANYLPTTLSNVAISWLINLPEESIYTWDQFCAIFIVNFQGTYERPSTAKTLKTIRQKRDESLRDYVEHFCNTRNAIPYIQDIKIINTFCDGVSDIKTVEEIVMKKSKTMADLLVVADTCIEASEAWARLLESHGMGPPKKKYNDREVNITDRGDRKDHGDRRYHCKQSSISHPIRKRRDISVALMTQRSGARFIAPQDMIWKSAKLFWIGRRCHRQQRRCHKMPVGANIVG